MTPEEKEKYLSGSIDEYEKLAATPVDDSVPLVSKPVVDSNDCVPGVGRVPFRVAHKVHVRATTVTTEDGSERAVVMFVFDCGVDQAGDHHVQVSALKASELATLQAELMGCDLDLIGTRT